MGQGGINKQIQKSRFFFGFHKLFIYEYIYLRCPSVDGLSYFSLDVFWPPHVTPCPTEGPANERALMQLSSFIKIAFDCSSPLSFPLYAPFSLS